MMFTTKMAYLVAVVLDRHVDKVTEELLRLGVLHYVNIMEIFDEWKSQIDPVTSQVSLVRLSETRKRIESFLQLSGNLQGYSQTLDPQNRKPVNLEESDRILDSIGSDLQGIRDRQNLIQKEILKLEDISRQLDMFGDIHTGIQSRSKYSFLTIQTGSVHTSRLDAFTTEIKTLPSVQLNFQEGNEGTTILLITMKRDDVLVDKILDKFGWVTVGLSEKISGSGKDAQTELHSKLNALRTEQDKIHADIHNIIEKKREILETMRVNTKINELFNKIQSYFGKTSRTKLFSGWLPASKQKTLDKAIRSITGGQCYLEWNDPEKLENLKDKNIVVPVQFKNPKFLSPFQMLVQNFSIPEYGTIDPTPFVAIAYLIMFGLMFCDAGHGAVLALIGLISSIMFKDKKESYYNISKLIIWCGFSSIFAGILFGSYFGMQWLKPIWFDYHGIISGHAIETGYVKDINGILSITLYFGMLVIGLGLILNWINKIVKRKWIDLIFDKGGLIGGWIYGSGIYTASYFIRHKYARLPDVDLIFFLLGLPAIILILKPPLEFIIHRQKDFNLKFTIFTPVDLFMSWVVEILEIFSGLLANTLSFMRIAGLGIAHVSLMVTFFNIAGMASGNNSSFNVWSYIILIFGNLIVIALEGLSAGVQSLRLNYYEFFSKFFSGTGKIYSPVSLSSRD